MPFILLSTRESSAWCSHISLIWQYILVLPSKCGILRHLGSTPKPLARLLVFIVDFMECKNDWWLKYFEKLG